MSIGPNQKTKENPLTIEYAADDEAKRPQAPCHKQKRSYAIVPKTTTQSIPVVSNDQQERAERSDGTQQPISSNSSLSRHAFTGPRQRDEPYHRHEIRHEIF